MRLGLNIGYSGARMSLNMPLIKEADRLGFHSVWSAEAYGSDAVTPLAWIAARTKTINVASGIMQMPARTPAMTAMTAKTLEYVEIVRKIWAREQPVEHQGEHYQIPYRGPGATGLGKPLKSILHGRQIPIYIAAIGPKSVEQAAEIADGWLPIWYSPHRTHAFKGALDAGFARAGGGKSLADFDIAASVNVV